MQYDLEMIVLACEKHEKRIEDFKKYGIINVGDNNVILNLILSNNEQIKDIETGWPENVIVKVHNIDSPNYVGNIFKFISEMNPQDLKSRWIMRLDDDSSTDIDGLIKNLDEFYDHNKDFYLGTEESPKDMDRGPELDALEQYKKEVGSRQKILVNLKHEIECCVLSCSAMKTILSNKMSMALLKKRSHVEGGVTDVALALAASLAKIYCIECPFLCHRPLVSDFSIAGGILNHIHMISRDELWDNFERTNIPFLFLERLISGMGEKEKSMENLKFICETEDFLQLFQLQSNNIFKVKFENRRMLWMEIKNKIIVFSEGEIIRSFNILQDGNLIENKNSEDGLLFHRV